MAAIFGSTTTTSTEATLQEEDVPTLQVLAADGDLASLQARLSNSTPDIVNAVDDSGLSPLASAASYGHAPVVEFLLSIGARCDIQDEDGDSPLHACNNVACAVLLLACDDCNPTLKNSEGVIAQALHEQELEELVMDTTVITVRIDESGQPVQSEPETKADIDPETLADLDRLRLLVNTLKEDERSRALELLKNRLVSSPAP